MPSTTHVELCHSHAGTGVACTCVPIGKNVKESLGTVWFSIFFYSGQLGCSQTEEIKFPCLAVALQQLALSGRVSLNVQDYVQSL